MYTWYLCSTCCSEPHCAHGQLSPFYHLSTLDVTHMRKDTRPPHSLCNQKQRGTGNKSSLHTCSNVTSYCEYHNQCCSCSVVMETDTSNIPQSHDTNPLYNTVLVAQWFGQTSLIFHIKKPAKPSTFRSTQELS